MPQNYPVNSKVYTAENSQKLNIIDLLGYFEKEGAMKVSDLHLKVGAPPTYRINGDLVKLKGATLTEENVKQLIYPLLSEKNLHKLENQHTVDTSYRLKRLQFRINVFKENDGICAAIRALSLDIPQIEKIGFPNNIWECIGSA